MARVKKRTDTSTNRESDKIIVRLPAGMRAHLADMAARHGRSMNAEVATALAAHIARGGEPDQNTINSSLADIKKSIDLIKEQFLAATRAALATNAANPDAVRETALAFREIMERQK